MKRVLSLLLTFCLLSTCFGFSAAFAVEDAGQTENGEALGALLAFPGAEGGGRYTKGARGALDVGGSIEVYHVTNLNSDGPGSFTEAVKADVQEVDGEGNVIEKPPVGRIVVFDVGGIINYPTGQKIDRDYITILGQTAPGDGITLTGGDLQIGNARQNVIIRYLRVRPTNNTGAEVDGIGGQWNKDVIIDHCSTSWSVDESLTLYAGSVENSSGYEQGSRLTVQNTISSESLRMSGHFKGAHGYGGILGGTNATYYRNLFAHHDSRSPRLDRVLQKTDFRNNVVYNWGVTNSAYGAEPTSPHPGSSNGLVRPSLVNYSNNYYSYGPSTVSGKRFRIFDFSSIAKEVGKTYKDVEVTPSQFYMADNYVDGSSTVTNNNWASDGINLSDITDNVIKMEEPFLLGDETYSDLNIPEDKLLAGKEVKADVLTDVGATLPKRDSIDARVVADAENRTGRIINMEEEVGGFTGIENSERVWEIPEEWKTANGMGSSSDSDIVESGTWAGYTWMEAYVNEWTLEQSETPPTNPKVTVTSPAIAAVGSTVNGQTVNNGNWSVIKDTDTLSYKANAKAVGDTEITKMELYDREELIKTYDGVAEINDALKLSIGTHYLSCLAYNNKGESTRSTTSIVYVNGTTPPEGWTYKQIGSPAYSGKGAISVDENGIYTIGGSGKIGGKADKCDFVYKKMSGEFDISLKIEDMMANENGAVMGLMVRESLDANSRMAALVDGWIKYGRNDRIVARLTKGGSIAVDKNQDNKTDNKMGIFMSGEDGEIVSGNVLGEHPYDTEPMGKYHLPNYLRIQRVGDMLIFSVSDSGTDWTDNARQPYILKISGLANDVYVGVAIDSQQGQSDASPKAYYSQAQFSELTISNESGYEPPTTPEPTPTVNPANAERYKVWLPGASTEGGDLATKSVINYYGKDALYVETFNVYRILDEPISSGKVNFNFDVFVDTGVDRSFRVYFENATGNWQNTDNVFAEIINNRNKQVNKGPGIDVKDDPLFTYEQLGESGWVHFDTVLDYSLADTDQFITITATNSKGEVLGTTTMGAIAGRDTTLKSIRLVKTASPTYFADMQLMKQIIRDDIYYVEAPARDGAAVSATVKNTADESGALFIAAAYEDGILADAKSVLIPMSEEDTPVSVTFDKEYSEVKCYLWSSESIEPYADLTIVK